MLGEQGAVGIAIGEIARAHRRDHVGERQPGAVQIQDEGVEALVAGRIEGDRAPSQTRGLIRSRGTFKQQAARPVERHRVQLVCGLPQILDVGRPLDHALQVQILELVEQRGHAFARYFLTCSGLKNSAGVFCAVFEIEHGRDHDQLGDVRVERQELIGQEAGLVDPADPGRRDWRRRLGSAASGAADRRRRRAAWSRSRPGAS